MKLDLEHLLQFTENKLVNENELKKYFQEGNKKFIWDSIMNLINQFNDCGVNSERINILQKLKYFLQNSLSINNLSGEDFEFMSIVLPVILSGIDNKINHILNQKKQVQNKDPHYTSKQLNILVKSFQEFDIIVGHDKVDKQIMALPLSTIFGNPSEQIRKRLSINMMDTSKEDIQKVIDDLEKMQNFLKSELKKKV